MRRYSTFWVGQVCKKFTSRFPSFDNCGAHFPVGKIIYWVPNATSKLQNCIMDIKNWMNVNKLKLNDSKTEFLIAASPYYEKRLPEITLTIGNSCIKPSQTI